MFLIIETLFIHHLPLRLCSTPAEGREAMRETLPILSVELSYYRAPWLNFPMEATYDQNIRKTKLSLDGKITLIW